MSEIRVTNIIGENGTDAVTFSKGLSTTGIVTATTFSGAYAGSGANLTSLNAGNISSGTLPTTRGGTGRADAQRLGGAWVKYRHDATVNDSYNVSSVTDNGEGEQTVNFSTSCSNNHYAVAAVCTYPSGTNSHFVSLGSRNQGWNANAQNTGSCKLWTIYTESSGNAQDVERVHAIFMGDWS